MSTFCLMMKEGEWASGCNVELGPLKVDDPAVGILHVEVIVIVDLPPRDA